MNCHQGITKTDKLHLFSTDLYQLCTNISYLLVILVLLFVYSAWSRGINSHRDYHELYTNLINIRNAIHYAGTSSETVIENSEEKGDGK